jgi:hypothetical protein
VLNLFWMASSSPCQCRFPMIIIRSVLVLVVCSLLKRWLCFNCSQVAAFQFLVKLLIMLSFLSSCLSGVYARDRWESLQCRSPDSAAKISSIWVLSMFLARFGYTKVLCTKSY